MTSHLSVDTLWIKRTKQEHTRGSYIFLEESHIIHLRFSQLIVSSKVLKQISAQEMKELKNFHFRENVKKRRGLV